MTVGSPLSAFNSQYGASGTDTTAANVILAEPYANASSPVNGTITTWHVTTITSGQFALRVLRPAGSQYTGVGRAAQSVASPGVHTFAANLPIQSGDLVGVDISDGAAVAAENANGSTYLRWVPALLDGSTKASDSNFGGEVLVSADVQYPEPAAPATKKKCKKKKKHRAAEAKKKCRKEEELGPEARRKSSPAFHAKRWSPWATDAQGATRKHPQFKPSPGPRRVRVLAGP